MQPARERAERAFTLEADEGAILGQARAEKITAAKAACTAEEGIADTLHLGINLHAISGGDKRTIRENVLAFTDLQNL